MSALYPAINPGRPFSVDFSEDLGDGLVVASGFTASWLISGTYPIDLGDSPWAAPFSREFGGGSIRVASGLTALWDIRQSVAAPFSFAWNIRALVTRGFTLKWQILIPSI